MGKDEVFKGEIEKASDFKFGENVAKVFDDMVNRSVPFYDEIQRMMAELAADHAKEGADVYDLGCSTGTTMIGMDTMVNQNIRFVGIDDSEEMLDKCKSKLMEIGFSRDYELRCADLNQGVKINKDIFFVSYANLPITTYLDEPPVASVEQFPYQQAEKATDILFRLINTKGMDKNIPLKTVLEGKVVVNVALK